MMSKIHESIRAALDLAMKGRLPENYVWRWHMVDIPFTGRMSIAVCQESNTTPPRVFIQLGPYVAEGDPPEGFEKQVFELLRKPAADITDEDIQKLINRAELLCR